MQQPNNHIPTNFNYQHIEFKNGYLSDIPSEYYSSFPPRNDDDPISQGQYYCDVLKFTKMAAPKNKVTPSSSNDNSVLDYVSKCLPVGAVFRNKSELRKAAREVCSKEMFVLSTFSNTKYKCNRADCPFAINFVAIFKKEPSAAAVKKSREARNSRKPNLVHCFEYPCAITKVNNTHNHPCDATNFHQATQASGTHSRSLTKEIVWMLIAMMRNTPSLNAAAISSVLNIVSPQCKVWNSDDICNVRAKVKKLINRYNITNDTSQKEFLQQFSDDEYRSFLDHT